MTKYACLFLLFVCLNQGCFDGQFTQFTQVIDIGVGTLRLPEGLVYNELQGIDSFVAEIVDPEDEDFIIRMDIGSLAGNYVDENDAGFQLGNSVNEEFLYVQNQSQYLGGGDCCSFFTFPNAGPANFITKNSYYALTLNILETFESN